MGGGLVLDNKGVYVIYTGNFNIMVCFVLIKNYRIFNVTINV